MARLHGSEGRRDGTPPQSGRVFCRVRRSEVAKRSRSVEWARRSIGVKGDGWRPSGEPRRKLNGCFGWCTQERGG